MYCASLLKTLYKLIGKSQVYVISAPIHRNVNGKWLSCIIALLQFSVCNLEYQLIWFMFKSTIKNLHRPLRFEHLYHKGLTSASVETSYCKSENVQLIDCQITAPNWNTYPNVVVILDKLRVSEQAPLQHGLQESQVDHVEQQQPQNGQVHYDGYLNVQEDFI